MKPTEKQPFAKAVEKYEQYKKLGDNVPMEICVANVFQDELRSQRIFMMDIHKTARENINSEPDDMQSALEEIEKMIREYLDIDGW